MATYVRFGSGFNITTNSSIDKRFVLTKAEMKAANPNGLPPVYFALCSDDKKMYIYDKNSVADANTGKYHLLEEYLDFSNSEEAQEKFDEALDNSPVINEINNIIDNDDPENPGLAQQVATLEETVEELTMNGGEVEGDAEEVEVIVNDKASLMAAASTIDNAYIILVDNVTFSGNEAVVVNGNKCTIDLNGRTITSTNNIPLYVSNGGELVIEGNGTVGAQECCALALGNSKITVNGGTYNTVDNAVFMTNGTVKPGDDRGHNIIEINGGVFNGHITTNNYIACGVYVANSDTVIINGGEFNITDGCGVCARSGNTVIGENVVFNITKENRQSGWVGDSKRMVPCDPIVLDLGANYPGGIPTLTNNSSYEVTTLD